MKKFILPIVIIIVLVIVLVVTLVTRKNSNGASSDTNIATTLDGTYCYEYHNTTATTTDTRSLQLILDGGQVTVTLSGYGQNTEYSAGYTGTAVGTIDQSGTINLESTIAISDAPGYTQLREERYTLRNGILTEQRFSYTEDFANKILRVDETVADNGQGQKFPIETVYGEVECN